MPRARLFVCPQCKSRNILVGTAYSFSSYIPENMRGFVKRVSRECKCRICKHRWESNHPLAMMAPEPDGAARLEWEDVIHGR